MAIQIWWKIPFAVIPLLAIRSRQTFAHATTAQLSCHVQNFVVITVWESRCEWNKIDIECKSRLKKRWWNEALVLIAFALCFLAALSLCSFTGLVGHYTASCWRHRMETILALLVPCEGNPPVTGGFPPQRASIAAFDFFYVNLYKRLNTQWYFGITEFVVIIQHMVTQLIL